MARTEAQKLSDKKYRESEKGKQKRKEYSQSEKGKLADKKYRQSEKGKQKIKKYTQSEKGKKARKEYLQSEKGAKGKKISNWKQLGLVWTTEEEIEEIYERYLASEKCEKKGCEYTETNWKCMDHMHLIGKYGYFRNIICNSCNVNDKSNNTSGVPNINKNGTGWAYEKMVNRKKHFKWFKTKEEACAYKIEYEEKYLK